MALFSPSSLAARTTCDTFSFQKASWESSDFSLSFEDSSSDSSRALSMPRALSISLSCARTSRHSFSHSSARAHAIFWVRALTCCASCALSLSRAHSCCCCCCCWFCMSRRCVSLQNSCASSNRGHYGHMLSLIGHFTCFLYHLKKGARLNRIIIILSFLIMCMCMHAFAYTDPLELTNTLINTQILHPTPPHLHPTHMATDLKLIAHHLGVLAEIRKSVSRNFIYLPGSSGQSNHATSFV